MIAVFGTQAIATLIAVFGIFMTPLGWGWAAFVWGYALIWFLVNDRVKLLAYRFLDPAKAGPKAKADAKSEAKAGAKSEGKSAVIPVGNAELKPEAKTEAQPEATAKSPPDLTSQIAKRAYALYEARGRQGGREVQDWEKAEQEIRKSEADAQPHSVQDWEKAQREIPHEKPKPESPK